MNQPTTWTARTITDALDVLRAVQERLESGLLAAYPGLDSYERKQNGQDIPTTMSITFDTSQMDRIAAERSVFETQVHDTP